jgi:EH_Signature domain
MNLGAPPSIHIRPIKLPDILEKVTQQLVLLICGGSVSGDLYHKVLARLRNKDWSIQDAREARLAVAALAQERGLLEYIDNSLPELFDILLSVPNANLAKSLVRLYYAKFLTMEVAGQTVIVVEAIKHCLRRYDGQNPLVLSVQNESKILKADFEAILKDHSYIKLEEIAKIYWFGVNDEFYEQLRITKILAHFYTLEFGKNWLQLFEEARKHRSRSARTQNGRNIGEEATYRLLKRCQNADQIPCETWQDFILQTVGDPRSHIAHHAWERIGTELKDYLVGILSRGDLKEFLESISDGQGDEIYQYRKHFWMQYLPYVKYAKLFASNNGFARLSKNMKNRFDSTNSAYSFVSGTNSSFVYIDFGAVKVIEGTHNAKVRFYNEPRQDIMRYGTYGYEVLRGAFIESKSHFNSDNYAWQKSVMNYLQKYRIGTDIRLENVLIDNETKSIPQIENWLVKNGYFNALR